MLGDRLRKLRKEKGIQIVEVAEYLGISRQGYGNYENGTREPSMAILVKLADFYEVSADYLLGREEQKFVEDVSKMSDNDLDKKLMQFFIELPESSKQGIRDFVMSLVSGLSETETIVETPPQIVQTQNSVEEPKRERVPYVARDLSGKNTKGFIDISDEDLAKAEVEDYSKYD